VIEEKNLKHGCVILADVHHPMLEATKGLLDVKFDNVVMVSTFESLLEAAIKIRPELIVADISLPSADGQKLLLKLDERLKGFKIIVLGSYNEADIVNSIFEKGIEGYVLKRLTATDLLQAVDKVISGETYVSSLAMNA
jgi:DNA-binding NarL/FixJ family response regulator